MPRAQMMRKQDGIGYDTPDANQDPVDYNVNQRFPAMDAQGSYDRAGALDYAEGYDVPGYPGNQSREADYTIQALEEALPKVAAQSLSIRQTPEERAAAQEQRQLEGYLAQIRYPQGNFPEGFNPSVGATQEQIDLASQATRGPAMAMEVNGQPASIVNALGQSYSGDEKPTREALDKAIRDIQNQKR